MKTSYQYYSKSGTLELVLKPETEEEYARFIDLDLKTALNYVHRLASVEFGDRVRLTSVDGHAEGQFRYRITTFH